MDRRDGFHPAGGSSTTTAFLSAGPARSRLYMSHLVADMHVIDGPPRITHFCRFANLKERMALRARHYAEGLWPPKGGPQQIERATSTIFLPEAWSPRC
ncbi:NIPSNAP family protein [Burkholderia cenocepacia]|uniref:NIPSNAP family protein n=1 Tax=Burkholderia cenocepacia TaxID=95486 RepID=A0ABD4ULS9_9BURK|nr:NIPSNAP family protein [Burkholderia cenocepacia]MCW3698922.1 NIPSNAP family protein [Burkholderia cenocepacia]MCW3706540.1 NIPSNAP family protein [Burkholderia cenocepacia]MCW3714969.1 NIPSNAP family protein [Burkholderia cenocepacia]MCW3722715.1 NIPSNAP family protein [Burkholderia cenocepacia]MCW3729769.1 NIPSNAP family protein [Burkholderia cenocepacia]